MTVFTICLAEIVFNVHCIFPSTELYCHKYLSKEKPKYNIKINVEDIEYERRISVIEASDNYLETLALYRKISELMINENGILFHSSAIELDGDAYLFTGTSGTGKSTHTRLWRETFTDKEIHMINDDKPLICFKEDGIYVYGTPWSGKSKLNENRKAKIKGICYLKQGKENKINRISKSEAFPLMMKQTYRSSMRTGLIRTINLLKELCETIPIYEMSCNISREAALTSYNCMKEG